MKKLSQIKQYLLIGVRALSEIPPILKDIPELNVQWNEVTIGTTIFELSQLRELLYQVEPNLRPSHMKLYEDNEAEYGVLANLIYLAEDCEKNGNRKDASDFYSELLEK